MDNLNLSLVGQQIARAMSGDPTATSVEQTISDALAGKSLGTLRARASSLMDFGRWKKGCAVNSTLLPITEEEAYLYVHELREHNAPRTKPARFVEALNFIYHMLGADVGNAMHSPRVKGATVVPFVVPKKKEPLSAAQVAFFERLAMTDAGQQGIIAGYVCMVLHMRLRWSDGQYCIDEPYTDLHCGHGFLECRLPSQNSRETEAFTALTSCRMRAAWHHRRGLGYGVAGPQVQSWPEGRQGCAYFAGPSCRWGLGNGPDGVESSDVMASRNAQKPATSPIDAGYWNSLLEGDAAEHDGKGRLPYGFEAFGWVPHRPTSAHGT